jgi:hypothetical protein
MKKNTDFIVLDNIPKTAFKEVDGRKAFSPKVFSDQVQFITTLLMGTQKTSYAIDVREQNDGFEIIATGMKIDPDFVRKSYQDKMNRGKDMARLVQEFAAPENNQTIFLPENLELDSERESSPEVISGVLHAKNGYEVLTLVEIQKRLTKSDINLSGEAFTKIDDFSNPFIVNESVQENTPLCLMLQIVDYSGPHMQLSASVIENGALSKPVKLRIAEELQGTDQLQFLLEHLKYSVESRATFEVLADFTTTYAIKAELNKISNIKIRAFLDDGTSGYRV